MKKLKKYLLTSLSLGLAGISVGAIVASCADDTSKSSDSNGSKDNGGGTTNNTPAPQANPADPSSTSSISTKAGDALTDAQIQFHTAKATEIEQAINAVKPTTAKPATEANVVAKIKEYKDNIAKNPGLKDFIAKTTTKTAATTNTSAVVNKAATKAAGDGTETNPPAPTPAEGIANPNETLYKQLAALATSFKQQNLLPTKDELSVEGVKNAEGSLTDPNTDISTDAIGAFAAFYLDPTDISMLAYYESLSKANSFTSKDVTLEDPYTILIDVFQLGDLLAKPTAGKTGTNGYVIWNKYAKVEKLIKEAATPTAPSTPADSGTGSSSTSADSKAPAKVS